MSDQQYPHPIAGAFIFNKENKLLVFRTYKWKDNWSIPGGHIEMGESIEDALKREAKEETGLDVYDPKLIVVLESIYDEQFHKPKHFIFLNHTCRTDSSKVTLNDEAEEYRWVTLEEALKLSLNSYTRQTIEKLLKEGS